MTRTTRLTALILALGAALALTSQPQAASAAPNPSCSVLAHRGDETLGAAENSLGGLKTAIADGADTLEVDVHVTSDMRIYLMHDDTVDRTTNGTGRVDSKTAAQMNALYMVNAAGKRTTEHPPSAKAALELAQSAGVKILVEMKGMGNALSYQRFADAITNAGISRVTVESQSAIRLGKIKALLPTVKTAIVRFSDQPSIATIHSWNADSLVIDQSQVTDAYLATLGPTPVYVFLVDDPAGWAALSGKVTGIMTSYVRDYLAWRATQRVACPTALR